MTVQTRALESSDEAAFTRFVGRLPQADHAFFKEDPLEPDVLHRWLHDARAIRIAAFDQDGGVAAVAAVWPGSGARSTSAACASSWRPTVGAWGWGAAWRTVLAQALRQGTWKISVEVVAREQATIDMFLALGFEPEALLRDQLRTDAGGTEDVVLLSHLADEAAQDALLAAPDGDDG